MRSDIIPGAIFPDYELSDHAAKHHKLSELQGQHPSKSAHTGVGQQHEKGLVYVECI